ncbi:hypothetical protein WFZ85_01135 [Flavobacterium sp. j3]|uniref:Peptidase M56 domain-containing protein n=1 Tax=Flavobacterium aureirubrum TaxID=3133147 RepID=A0ABU9N318_9FLAO
MVLIISKYLVPKGYKGITIFPFVILAHPNLKNNKVILNHERIHIRQQLELLIIPFIIWYGLEFLVRFFQYGNLKLAYINISFEREAYANEKNLNFLKNRFFLNHFKFIKK